jgi:hypothetical protein
MWMRLKVDESAALWISFALGTPNALSTGPQSQLVQYLKRGPTCTPHPDLHKRCLTLVVVGGVVLLLAGVLVLWLIGSASEN